MARPLRIQYPGAVYHVMNRGNSFQKIFRSTKTYQIFLTLLEETVNMWDIRIHAFSLMPNHYHLLIETPLGNLARAMRHIDGVYTQRFNKIAKTDGHLFRGRYKAILVEDDAYLVELLRYIHLNPVEARMVKEPQAHKWTSHSCYLGGVYYKWLTTARLLRYFGKRVNLARRKLHEFVKEGVPLKLQEQLDGEKWPTVLSSENFMDWVKWNFVKGQGDRELKYEEFKFLKISEEELKKILCSVLNVDWKELCCARGREAKLKRGLAIRSFRMHMKYTYNEISLIFGGIHPSNIARAITRNNEGMEALWEQVCAEIQNAKRKT